jgi:hypothetical protein
MRLHAQAIGGASSRRQADALEGGKQGVWPLLLVRGARRPRTQQPAYGQPNPSACHVRRQGRQQRCQGPSSPHVQVGTPGRTAQLLEQGPLRVWGTRLLVLDEVPHLTVAWRARTSSIRCPAGCTHAPPCLRARRARGASNMCPARADSLHSRQPSQPALRPPATFELCARATRPCPAPLSDARRTSSCSRPACAPQWMLWSGKWAEARRRRRSRAAGRRRPRPPAAAIAARRPSCAVRR